MSTENKAFDSGDALRGAHSLHRLVKEPIPIHVQGTCPKCGSNKWHGGIAWVLYASCDICGHIWQHTNRLPNNRSEARRI